MFCPFCESEDSEERQDGVIETSGEENSTAEGRSQAAGADQPVSKNGGSRRCCAEKGDKGMSQLWW